MFTCNGINFESRVHYEFFEEKMIQLRPDCYLNSLIYTLGICHETRAHWHTLYDEVKGEINPDAIQSSWKTSGSIRVTRLAFHLFTNSMPTVNSCDKREQLTCDCKECQQYSIVELFCDEHAPYFVEVIKLRFPSSFRDSHRH
jgi:hypothetical protein